MRMVSKNNDTFTTSVKKYRKELRLHGAINNVFLQWQSKSDVCCIREPSSCRVEDVPAKAGQGFATGGCAFRSASSCIIENHESLFNSNATKTSSTILEWTNFYQEQLQQCPFIFHMEKNHNGNTQNRWVWYSCFGTKEQQEAGGMYNGG